MKVPITEKGLIYAEVNTRKDGLTYAEVGLIRAEMDTKSLCMLENEQEGSQRAKATTRLTTQLGDTPRSTTRVGDMTRPTTRATDISTVQLKMPVQAGRKRELWKLHSQRCRVPVTRIKANPERGEVWKSETQGIRHGF